MIVADELDVVLELLARWVDDEEVVDVEFVL